jgi:chromosome partitioning protein
MLVVALASQKGGSGKTTLAGHLAVEAEKAGAGAVALIDTDPQGSLSHWWNARAAGTPHFAQAGVFDLASVLNHLRQKNIKLAIVDTPPAITDSIAEVISRADLVIVPTRPSPHDLRAVGATVDIAERYDRPLLFVINAATARARITGEAAVALSQHGTVAPVTIHARVDFAASMVDGRTVGEVLPKSASANEISDLWLYVQDRLAKLKKEVPLAQADTQHLALGPMSAPSQDEAGEEVLDPPPSPEPGPSTTPPRPYEGVDRRVAGKDRREIPQTEVLFGGQERRRNIFGRRSTDYFK